MSHAARALTVIALMLPVSAVTGTFFSVLRRRTGRGGKGKHTPTVSAAPQIIPDGARAGDCRTAAPFRSDTAAEGKKSFSGC